MNEKEDVEFAAKAAGIPIAWGGPDGDMARRTDTWESFSPRTDNGDALWLAAKLQMDIAHFSFGVRVSVEGGDDHYQPINDGEDRCAALRLAITNTAAEVGKAMA